MDIILEIIIEIVFAPLFELFSGRIKKRGPEKRDISPSVMGLCLVSFGLILGSVSLLVFKSRILPQTGFRGMSLLLAPVIGGLIMKAYGTIRIRYNREASILGTFTGGAAFAFSIALVRFLLIGKNA